jgi:HK97 family phage prohead protease
VNQETFFETLALVPNLRSARFNDLEITETNGRLRFRGHAAVFDEEADLGEFTESIQRGAFRKVLQQPANIPLTLEHDPTKVLATTRSGLLKLEEDAKGLAVDADVPPTSMARDLKELVDADVVNGMSFGFVAGPRTNYRVERRSNGKPHRSLLGFKKLLDVCTTWDPSYRSAEAQFRSLTLQYADSPESLQHLLMGAYPQLGERAETPGGTDDEAPAADEAAPDEETDNEVGEGADAGADEPEHRSGMSLAAAQNRLLLMTIDLKGDMSQ